MITNNDNVTLKIGTQAQVDSERELDAGKVVGQILIGSDTGNMYLNTSDSQTIQLGGNGENINLNPNQIIFPNGQLTTYPLGKVELENGSGVLIEPGGTLQDFFDKLVYEQNPTITEPSISLTFDQAGEYEVGTRIIPTYKATLNPGSYSYGPATGVTATSWMVSDIFENIVTTATGNFTELQVSDTISYTITARVNYGAGNIPLTNLKNEYPIGQILAGSKSAISQALTGYRNTFYGTLTSKENLTSNIIRHLNGKSNQDLFAGKSFTIAIPVNAMRVIIAYPATLRDLTSVKDVNGMSAEIVSSFKKQIIAIEGANNYTAIDYKVYYLDFANPNDKINKFIVTI